jgi:hypothetical protein
MAGLSLPFFFCGSLIDRSANKQESEKHRSRGKAKKEQQTEEEEEIPLKRDVSRCCDDFRSFFSRRFDLSSNLTGERDNF